ncbi:hypothetical protein L083_7991 [Actinoplanes sp. N902-109]|nr:hypothetical protein L083_7991 [Actinoplanes sp. N902-109]
MTITDRDGGVAKREQMGPAGQFVHGPPAARFGLECAA